MFPQDKLSTVPETATFLGARNLSTSDPMVDYEDGGIALSDATQGLQVQAWRAKILNGKDVVLDVPSVPTILPETIFSLSGISHISFTFDSAMYPVISFMKEGVAYIRWYSALAPAGFKVTAIAGGLYPKVSLDDKRELESINRDIILSYTKADGCLYFRKSRDRYSDLAEKKLYTGLNGLILRRTGMNIAYRFQWELQTQKQMLLQWVGGGNIIEWVDGQARISWGA